MSDYIEEMSQNDSISSKGSILPKEGVLKCRNWVVDDANLIVLPSIPLDLPALRDGGIHGAETKLVKIAVGDNFVIALTNGGHVLGMDISITAIFSHIEWKYVSETFSCFPVLIKSSCLLSVT